MIPTVTDQSIKQRARRVTGLARANGLLLVRNRLTLAYGLVLPLLPMGLLLVGDRGETEVGMQGATTALLMILLFPVFYNLLSMVVTRRDELVLKRLRTGETTDLELLTSMALPGAVLASLLSVLMVVAGLVLGLPWPASVLVLVAGVLLSCVLFSVLAIWTAAWTRNAEAAQMTSLPVMLLALIGTLTSLFPASWETFLALTPGDAIGSLLRIGWAGHDDGQAVEGLAVWAHAAQPMVVLLAWIVIGVSLARRYLRWEPRT